MCVWEGWRRWGGLLGIDVLTGACEAVRLHNQVTWSRSGAPQTLATMIGLICASPLHPHAPGGSDTHTHTHAHFKPQSAWWFYMNCFSTKVKIEVSKTKLMDQNSIFWVLNLAYSHCCSSVWGCARIFLSWLVNALAWHLCRRQCVCVLGSQDFNCS